VQLKIVLKEETPSKGNARQSPNFVQRDSSNINVIQITKGAPFEEVRQKLGAFWAFIASLQHGCRESAIKNISESGKIPTATLCFDSPLSPDTILLPTPHGIERNEMVEVLTPSSGDDVEFCVVAYSVAI
jgi:hypothetical protein